MRSLLKSAGACCPLAISGPTPKPDFYRSCNKLTTAVLLRQGRTPVRLTISSVAADQERSTETDTPPAVHCTVWFGVISIGVFPSSILAADDRARRLQSRGDHRE